MSVANFLRGIRSNPLFSRKCRKELKFFGKYRQQNLSFVTMLIDTHTHLYSEAFDDDRDEMIQRALGLDITKFVVPAIDSHYTKAMYDLEKAYPKTCTL